MSGAVCGCTHFLADRVFVLVFRDLQCYIQSYIVPLPAFRLRLYNLWLKDLKFYKAYAKKARSGFASNARDRFCFFERFPGGITFPHCGTPEASGSRANQRHPGDSFRDRKTTRVHDQALIEFRHNFRFLPAQTQSTHPQSRN
jgi:hypothetical protein